MGCRTFELESERLRQTIKVGYQTIHVSLKTLSQEGNIEFLNSKNTLKNIGMDTVSCVSKKKLSEMGSHAKF
jgi:hypothetical protein